jgi:hypothetical protein
VLTHRASIPNLPRDMMLETLEDDDAVLAMLCDRP